VARFFLFPLQLLVSALYYITAPFTLTPLILFFWFANSLCVLYFIRNGELPTAELSANFKRARLVFTATLVLLELTININSDSYAADNFHGLVSDMEVLITGITLGVLWFQELTAKR